MDSPKECFAEGGGYEEYQHERKDRGSGEMGEGRQRAAWEMGASRWRRTVRKMWTV